MSTKCTGKVSTKKFSVKTVSKWLTGDEARVFCNVMENGDILEVQDKALHIWGIGMKTSMYNQNRIRILYGIKQSIIL